VTSAAAVRLLARRSAGGSCTLVVLLLLALLTSTLTPALAAPAAAAPSSPRASEHESETPLQVSIRSMTPSTLPRRGEVTLTGEVTNRSDQSWSDMYAYLFVSSEPITTSDELAEATGTDPALPVGARLTRRGLYDEVSDLAPGETTNYTVTVPRRELPRGAGVYWIGVHVLGATEDGRIDGADGRARTFITAMPTDGSPSTLSLVMPFRAPVRRTPEGQLARPDAWRRMLADEGRLSRLLELVEDADTPLSVVVDPAVLDAARSMAAANPEFDLTPTDGDPQEGESTGPEAPLTEDPGPVQEGTDDEAPDDVTELSPEAQRAADWLTGFSDMAQEQSLLALPYGDLDAASALRRGRPEVFDRATELSASTMEDLGMDATPVVAPPDGLLPSRALDDLDPEARLLLSERAAGTDATTIRLGREMEAVLTSDVARIGGPGPTPPFDALALRQQILASAAVHGLSGARSPLVVSMPDLWNPGKDWRDASFFDGLDVPWLRTVNTAFAEALSTGERYDEPLTYPRAQRRDEIPAKNLRATERLSETGTVLATLLTRNDTIDEQASRVAMLSSSVHARAYPRRARSAARQVTTDMRTKLDQVTVESSSLVTMSSESGAFQVTVVNDLDEPVTVGVAAEAEDDGLKIRSPDLVSLGAGQRASVRLSVTATGSGVHSVLVRPTTSEGHPIGRSTKVTLRSSQVGFVIWVIMGTGAVVFVAAIAARIVRRVRSRRTVRSESKEDALA